MLFYFLVAVFAIVYNLIAALVGFNPEIFSWLWWLKVVMCTIATAITAFMVEISIKTQK